MLSRKYVIYLVLTMLMWATVTSAGMVAFTWQWWAMAALWIGNSVNEGIE